MRSQREQNVLEEHCLPLLFLLSTQYNLKQTIRHLYVTHVQIRKNYRYTKNVLKVVPLSKYMKLIHTDKDQLISHGSDDPPIESQIQGLGSSECRFRRLGKVVMSVIHHKKSEDLIDCFLVNSVSNLE